MEPMANVQMSLSRGRRRVLNRIFRGFHSVCASVVSPACGAVIPKLADCLA